jgi:hypothetical protein
VPGDRVISYIDKTADQTANIIRMMVHERCAEAFFGTARVQ